jgi:hypothetical protein
MNTDDLSDWARRAAADLRSYADAAAEAGTPQADTEALLSDLDDIRAGRPLWQRRYAERCDEQLSSSFLSSL